MPVGFGRFSNAGRISIVERCGLLIQVFCGTAIPVLLQSDIYRIITEFSDSANIQYLMMVT